VTTTRELLARLVAIDTTSLTPNVELLDVVEELLDRHGAEHERVWSPDGTRANLIARIGPAVEGGVVLSAHTDCVPVDGQDWNSDPFTLREDAGRLHGRGTADMKGFLASALAAVPAIAAADLRRPILFVLSYDEELGTMGAPSAVERLIATQPRPAAVVVGEPTSMEVVGANKGVRAFTVTVDGVDGHSSRPHEAANAVAAAARIAAFVDDLAATRRQGPPDPAFDPPHTTFNLATIRGGQAINIVPRRCELTFEYRPVPADDGPDLADEVARFATAQVLPRLREGTGRGEITFRTDASAPALAPEPDGAADRLVRRLVGDDGPARSVPFATDGGHFQAAGLSTVVCGPGSIAQAHRPDEWVGVEQLAACDGLIRALVAELSA
jgi:acetylornithine deacetylase